MEKKPVQIDISDYPSQIQPYLINADIYDSSCGENSQVLYSSADYYIKIAPKGTLEREAAVIDYFYDNGIGAELVKFISADKDYMVTRPAPGQDATHYLDNPQKLCETLAAAMKYLHSLPMNSIVLSPSMEYYKSDNILDCNTFIHGDFCLPNIMLENYNFKAFIDVGLAGAGDRHIDIFWCIWSLWFNLKTDKYTDYFLDLYGRENVDMSKLKYIAVKEDKL